jgi:hypothetical protein
MPAGKRLSGVEVRASCRRRWRNSSPELVSPGAVEALVIRLPLCIATLVLLAALPGHADVLVSPAHRVQLLELYTSEGCSSCPPADRWLTGLLSSPDLWCEVVPVAFHVDYWDYIGWRDRFASAAFSARQRRYTAEGAVSSVYTPGFVLGGEEWRGWFRDQPELVTQGDPAPVDLELEFADAEGRLRVSGEAGPYVGYVAWLGFDQSTDVSRGENSGKTLRHDFVVLHLEEVPLHDSNRALMGNFRAPADLPASDRYALAAWASARGSMRPLQSVGGWLGPQGALLPRDGC